MKITKRQLRRIIKEEKAKLIEANHLSGEAIRQMSAQDEQIQSAIDGWSFRSEEELYEMLRQIGPRTNQDPKVIDAMLETLEWMKAHVIEWGDSGKIQKDLRSEQ